MADELPRVIICQGPPRCDYDAGKPGADPERDLPCPWCRIDTQDRNGVWHTQEPATA